MRLCAIIVAQQQRLLGRSTQLAGAFNGCRHGGRVRQPACGGGDAEEKRWCRWVAQAALGSFLMPAVRWLALQGVRAGRAAKEGGGRR